MRTFNVLKTFAFPLVLAAVMTVPSCGSSSSSPDVKLDTDTKRISYTIGVNIGQEFTANYVDVDAQALARGIEDVINNSNLMMTQEEMSSAMTQLNMSQQTRMQEIADQNLREATAFIVENAGKPGIVTLPDSLQYEVITEGSGAVPKMGDMIRAHYTGSLLDGTVFDSSVTRGEPIDLMLGQVIEGWDEALTLMPVGSKWTVYIPPALAYGPNSQPPIPPNSLLIFEIELLDIITPTEE